MLSRLVPESVMNALNNYKLANIYELRVRRGSPIVINYSGRNMVLTSDGRIDGESIFADSYCLEYILKKATENSLYAYNNQLKQGFITARGGIRLGIAGESVVSDNFMPTTIKNINAINIRIPHEVFNCSDIVFKYIFNKDCGIKNTLIISPPGAGKTTLLRDIARKLSQQETIYNTFLVDERFEIASVVDGEPMLDVGFYTDILSGANKDYAFSNGIRALKPDVIITDELIGVNDIDACMRAMRSGVKVIATIHANNHRELCDKSDFKKVFNGRFFERYIVLSSRYGAGTCEGVFDQNLNCICF